MCKNVFVCVYLCPLMFSMGLLPEIKRKQENSTVNKKKRPSLPRKCRKTDRSDFNRFNSTQYSILNFNTPVWKL